MSTSAIKTGDRIDIGLKVPGATNSNLVSTVTPSVDSVTKKNKYTIVTPAKTVVVNEDEIVLSEPKSGGRSTYVVCQ